jgi:hypothetical protein
VLTRGGLPRIVAAYWCQVHHTKDFAKGGRTDIDEETLACGPHNRLATDGGWTTGKRPDGTTEWIPPPHLDRGHRVHKRLRQAKCLSPKPTATEKRRRRDATRRARP